MVKLLECCYTSEELAEMFYLRKYERVYRLDYYPKPQAMINERFYFIRCKNGSIQPHLTKGGSLRLSYCRLASNSVRLATIDKEKELLKPYGYFSQECPTEYIFVFEEKHLPIVAELIGARKRRSDISRNLLKQGSGASLEALPPLGRDFQGQVMV